MCRPLKREKVWRTAHGVWRATFDAANGYSTPFPRPDDVQSPVKTMCNDGKEYAPPWKSWLTTAGLVFLGVTLGALVAASLVAPGPPHRLALGATSPLVRPQLALR